MSGPLPPPPRPPRLPRPDAGRMLLRLGAVVEIELFEEGQRDSPGERRSRPAGAIAPPPGRSGCQSPCRTRRYYHPTSPALPAPERLPDAGSRPSAGPCAVPLRGGLRPLPDRRRARRGRHRHGLPRPRPRARGDRGAQGDPARRDAAPARAARGLGRGQAAPPERRAPAQRARGRPVRLHRVRHRRGHGPRRRAAPGAARRRRAPARGLGRLRRARARARARRRAPRRQAGQRPARPRRHACACSTSASPRSTSPTRRSTTACSARSRTWRPRPARARARRRRPTSGPWA